MIAALDAMTDDDASTRLIVCCGSRRWVSKMLGNRPFRDAGRLHASADQSWDLLGEVDRLEAFAAHPRIGSKGDVGKKSGAERSWSEREQAGTASASDAIRTALAEANVAYQTRFGFVFLICATGKSASEMLESCRERVKNDRARELAIAGEEQRKIMHLRLDKMLAMLGGDAR